MAISPELRFSLSRRRGSWLPIVLCWQPDKKILAFCDSSSSPAVAWETHLCLSQPPGLFVFSSRPTAWPQTALCLLLKLGHVKTSCHSVLSISVLQHTHTLSRCPLGYSKSYIYTRNIPILVHCPLLSVNSTIHF